ncbi:MAG: Maf family protein [Gammaproteobacteria bacterium]|nr:Maf family protein [Gammaproteobacteria bacterium]
MTDRYVYLASASPRRRELLDQIGVPYRLQPADVDETARAGEPPDEFALRMAKQKARTAQTKITDAGRPVLGADTVVSIAGDILGKPASEGHATEMLRRLSGKRHEVTTAVAVVKDAAEYSAVSTSEVEFRELSDAEIAAYLNSGESDDKAGAYAIQGLAAAFIARLQGSYSGVVGLPLFETAELLSQVGITIFAQDEN